MNKENAFLKRKENKKYFENNSIFFEEIVEIYS
jgi:hypothetical protein